MNSSTVFSMAHLRRHADHAGTITSGVCLVHCLLTPVLISVFPGLLPWLPGDAFFHRILACAIVLMGTIAFIPGYRVHRQPLVPLMVAIGTPLIVIVAWCGPILSTLAELSLSVSGSMILIAAHLLNRSFCSACEPCRTSDTCHTTKL